jgi:hypothetical protein
VLSLLLLLLSLLTLSSCSLWLELLSLRFAHAIDPAVSCVHSHRPPGLLNESHDFPYHSTAGWRDEAEPSTTEWLQGDRVVDVRAVGRNQNESLVEKNHL